MENSEINIMATALSEKIENNASDAPHLSIDPDTGQTAAIGDANKISSKSKDYKLTFSYEKSEIRPDELSKYQYDEKTDTYLETLSFTDKRIKPIYRAQVVLLLTQILDKVGVLLSDGYDSNVDTTKLATALYSSTDQFIELAHIILGITTEQAQHLMPLQMVDFLNQLIENEPNIIGECSNFLSF